LVHPTLIVAAVGQDREHEEGVGNLICVDAGIRLNAGTT